MADRSVSVFLRANVDGYMASISKAKLATSDFASQASRDALKNREDWERVGKGMLVTGGVIAAGIGLAIKASMDFRAQMAQVQSLSGATASQMRQLSDAALTVGQKYGFTATQVAEAQTELVKAGLSVKDILGGALQGALTLAADGQMNVADATQIAVSAMTQFKLTGADVPHVADLLAAGADKALGSVGDLGYALSQSGTMAHQFGWSLDETVGTLAEFAQNAQIGEKGGTQLRQMLVQLVTPSAQASALMSKYGFSVHDANGNMVSSTELAGRLQKSFGSLTPAIQQHAIATIFGSHAQAAANILMSDGAKVNAQWVASVNDQGFAAKQAAGKMDSLAGDVSKLHAAFQTGLIETGDEAESNLRGLTTTLTGVIQAYDNASPAMKGFIVDLGVQTAGVTLLGGAALVTVPKIAAMVKSLKALSVVQKVGGLGPAAGIAALLTAGVTGIEALNAYQNKQQDTFTNRLRNSPQDMAQARLQLAQLQKLQAQGGGVPGSAAGRGANQELIGRAAAIQRLTKEIAAAGIAQDTSTKSLGEAQKAQDQTAQSVNYLDGQYKTTVFDITDFSKALDALRQNIMPLQSAQDQLTSDSHSLGKAVKDQAKQFKDSGHAVKGNTDEALANRAALRGLTGDAVGVIEAYAKTGKTSDQVAAKTLAVRDNFVKLATKAGFTKGQIADYIAQIDKVPGDITSSIILNGVNQSMTDLERLTQQAQQYDAAIRAAGAQGGQKGAAAARNAHGKTIATGGPVWGAGTATSDSIPAWLSNGEFVINAASAQRIGYSNLDALNRFARGGGVGLTKRHFATGGMAGDPDMSLIQSLLSQTYATSSDVTTARTRQAHATATLLAAEAALQKLRKGRHTTDAQIHAAEARITADRSALASATSKLKSTEASYTAGKKPLADRYASSVASAARTDSTFLANLKKIAARGYGPLAQELYAEGDADAMQVAAQMVNWSNAKLYGVQKNLQASASAVAGLAALFNPQASTPAPDQGQGPAPVFVQNPWTGEYLLAKTDQRVSGALKTQNRQIASGTR